MIQNDAEAIKWLEENYKSNSPAIRHKPFLLLIPEDPDDPGPALTCHVVCDPELWIYNCFLPENWKVLYD